MFCTKDEVNMKRLFSYVENMLTDLINAVMMSCSGISSIKFTPMVLEKGAVYLL